MIEWRQFTNLYEEQSTVDAWVEIVRQTFGPEPVPMSPSALGRGLPNMLTGFTVRKATEWLTTVPIPKWGKP